jgi:hypothetical protein
MDISSVSSFSNGLANQATGEASSKVSDQIAAAVMKQMMRQQEVQTQGLLNMMSFTPSLTGSGSLLDRYA